MPEVSRFYGISIRFRFREHPPAHYGEHVVQIEIDTGEPLEGFLPPRALKLVREWAALHRDELFQNWANCRADAQTFQIEPLE